MPCLTYTLPSLYLGVQWIKKMMKRSSERKGIRRMKKLMVWLPNFNRSGDANNGIGDI